MMMKRILLACISLFFLGCGNFLDINPESEVVNDDMFSTAEGVEDALYGVYMSMGEGGYVWWGYVCVDTGVVGAKFCYG